MARKARELSITNIYHVVIKGTNKQLLFEEKSDYNHYIDLLELYKEECGFNLYAYCLMDNHIHLLIKANEISISKIFRHISTSYSMWFNMKYQRTGYLQQGRFYSEPVNDYKYFLNVLCYIHFNPYKAGLESHFGISYKWSSYNEYFSKSSLITDIDYPLELIGGRKKFIELHESYKEGKQKFLDIDSITQRLPDDVAKERISKLTGCNTISEFQNLKPKDRNHFIRELHKQKLSIRQINRLTGISKGIIEKILKTEGHSSRQKKRPQSLNS